MYLEREDVRLYYEVHGEGEPLLLIHGVIVDSDLYRQTAKYLSKYYQVITYDRRGNSRSTCERKSKFHIKEQTEDILNLMDALGIDKINIVGSSAGAVIGQYFLQEYPDRVRHLIMYEPGMLGLMMNISEEFRVWVAEMEKIINKGKYNTALLKFAEHIGTSDPRSPQKEESVSLREMENIEYAFKVEIPGLIAYQPDIDRMKLVAEKITIAAGEKSGDTMYVQMSASLAKQIGKENIFYPGGHNLPYDLPKEFAVCVLGTLMLQDEC